MQITLTKATVLAATCVLVLASCADGAAEPSSVSEPWKFGGSVPEDIGLPIPSAGEVVNSLDTADRVTVMLAYPETRLLELVAFYDLELQGTPTSRSEHTIDLEEWGTAWMVRWSADRSEVRVGQCIDPFARTLTLVCVVIDQDG
ncbi:MAG: hypothetical protein WD990_11665 [Acidimicrobiia bacterium]